ncbi:MAG: hypothetical protein HOP14_09015 [Acidobacteria bacterium]|nr:hypothetical protein [Acidobacteriota bacterium]
MLFHVPPPLAFALALPALCGGAARLAVPLAAASDPRPAVEAAAPSIPHAGVDGTGARVRGLDAPARRLLSAGMQRSPTIRALVGLLERSDLVVLVDTGTHHAGRSRATTRLAAVRAGIRFLRLHVELGYDLDTPAPLALLAHELEHAREIQRAAWVVDDPGLRQLYRRIGFPSCPERSVECFETEGALERGRMALRELSRPR